MSELPDAVEAAIPLGLHWESQWNEYYSGQSPVELTPPSASSVGELTPVSLDNDVLYDSIGYHKGKENSNNADSSSTARFATAIEGVVSSAVRTASPLARQQAWASIEAIAKENIARIHEEGLSWPRMKRFPEQETAQSTSHQSPIRSHQAQKVAELNTELNLQYCQSSMTNQDLIGKSLDISLQVSTGGHTRTHLSRGNSRAKKNHGRLSTQHHSSADGNSIVQTPRRGRPSERGFSCSHCKITKKKCIGNSICCDTCSKSPIYRQLCIRADFKESRLILHDLYKTRIQPLLSNVVERTLRDPSPEPVKITLSNGFNPRLQIEVERYVAFNKNALTHRIFRGLEPGTTYPTARSTPFSLRDGTLTTQKIDSYCEDLACDMVQRESLGLARNSLLNHIILFAAAQINDEDIRARIEGLEMVRLALRFWAMQAIFFTYPWRIENGGHLVGMFPLQLRGYWNGITLLPRLVNQELDRAFETRMDEIEKEILEKLQAAIFTRHRSYWCSIFLSSFILLQSLERDTWNMSAWDYEIRSQGSAAWPLSKSPSEYCQQNKHIAEIVATHFKVVNQGSSPLKQNWNKPLNQQLLSNSMPARRFILSIQSDFNSPASHYKAELNQPKEFARGDPRSLNYVYTKMLFGD